MSRISPTTGVLPGQRAASRAGMMLRNAPRSAEQKQFPQVWSHFYDAQVICRPQEYPVPWMAKEVLGKKIRVQ